MNKLKMEWQTTISPVGSHGNPDSAEDAPEDAQRSATSYDSSSLTIPAEREPFKIHARSTVNADSVQDSQRYLYFDLQVYKLPDVSAAFTDRQVTRPHAQTMGSHTHGAITNPQSLSTIKPSSNIRRYNSGYLVDFLFISAPLAAIDDQPSRYPSDSIDFMEPGNGIYVMIFLELCSKLIVELAINA